MNIVLPDDEIEERGRFVDLDDNNYRQFPAISRAVGRVPPQALDWLARGDFAVRLEGLPEACESLAKTDRGDF